MRTLVLGDLHGSYRALLQVFERANFDYEKDHLISLGDVADGWPEVPECFEELLKVKHLDYIMGNHDYWLYEYFHSEFTPELWLSQGGYQTIQSYKKVNTAMKDRHLDFLEQAVAYLVKNDKLFVHGGFNWHAPIETQDPHDLMWDRNLFEVAKYWQKQANRGIAMDEIDNYDEVFIGHTTTSRVDPELKPVHISNVWNLDQGAGFEGKLTLMDVDTKEYFQSDIVKTLYPKMKGR